MMKTATAVLIATLGLAPQGLAAEPFRLTGPLVAKLDWTTRAMSAGDLDGDGRLDVAVLNNDSAQIELLYQRTAAEIRTVAPRKVGSPRWEPILESAPFLRENELTGDFMYDLELLDVDLDGRLDLVYTGKRDRLAVKLQTQPGVFEEEWYYDKEEPSANVDSLAAADVDGDGHADLVALANQAILVFTLRAGGSALPQPQSYRVGEENPQRLRVIDLNRDGRLDLAYMATSSERALRVRYQTGDGGFGPEFSIPVKVGAPPWAVLGSGDAERLVTIKPTRSELQFTPLLGSTGARRQALDIRNYPVPKSGTNPALFAVGDFDGDNRKDVVVADADGSAVYLYTQDETGEFRQPREFPSLNGITSLGAIRLAGTTRDALLVSSEKEGMLGISSMSDGGRLEFPHNIAVPGTPIVAIAADLNGDGTQEIAVATKDGRRSGVEILSQAKGGFEAGESVQLGSLKRDPSSLLAEDLDGDGAADITLFIPREPTRFFLQRGALLFEEAGEKDSVRTSQFEGVLPDRFAVGDFTGNGRREMLVAGKGYVRAYRFSSDGNLEIVDQANARSSLDEVAGPLLFDIDGDGTTELLVYHANDNAVQVLKKDAAGLFSYSRAVDVAPIALVEAHVVDLGGAAGTRLMFFGKDRFWSIPSRVPDADDAARSSYRTDLEDVQYTDFTLGDLNGDGQTDVIAIDAAANVLDILDGTPATGFTSAMFFRVFEKNRFVNNNRGSPLQPRETLVADFDADLRPDLLLLCHDRILLYPQDANRGNP